MWQCVLFGKMSPILKLCWCYYPFIARNQYIPILPNTVESLRTIPAIQCTKQHCRSPGVKDQGLPAIRQRPQLSQKKSDKWLDITCAVPYCRTPILPQQMQKHIQRWKTYAFSEKLWRFLRFYHKPAQQKMPAFQLPRHLLTDLRRINAWHTRGQSSAGGFLG